MIRFTINWKQVANGNEFTTDYVFDGCGCQKGFDLIGWTLYCLRFGQKQCFSAGIKDIKLKNSADYPGYADKLFQSVTESGKSLTCGF